MNDLIKALAILAKYNGMGEKYDPTHCEHDELMIPGVDPDGVTPEDLKALDDLGFVPNSELEGFVSYRFGSC